MKKYLGIIIAVSIFFIGSVISPLSTSAITEIELTEEQLELSNLIKLHLNFDVEQNRVVIRDEEKLKKVLKSSLNEFVYEATYNEIDAIIEKMNEIINSKQGEKIKSQIFSELRQQENEIIIAGLSGCGYASIAGYVHTGAFAGFMTLAGVGGPASWAIGSAVGGVWLAAQAAAGCLA